ncbi:hypothetical protein INT43_001571 [Umbelopsis isabellina]|uniref:Uncharacterized protein n=1 Tax=Mortierella isabellina TaxID=91625 RepID=A0A8H7PDU7_MORIS|nr:hypothetical protein INT43_001571 [Umbelopsis isabellina]
MFKSTLTVLLSLACASMVYADCAITLVSTTKAVTCVKTSATTCTAADTNTPLAATCPFTQNQVIAPSTDSHLHICNSDASLATGRTTLIGKGFTCAAIATVDTCPPVSVCGNGKRGIFALLRSSVLNTMAQLHVMMPILEHFFDQFFRLNWGKTFFFILAYMDDGAFELTWRNYFPSPGQLCACFPATQGQPIQLPPDDTIPQHYNHQPVTRKKKRRQRQTDEGYVTGLESIISNTTTDTDQSSSSSRGRRSKRPSSRRSKRRNQAHSRSQFYEIYPEENIEDAQLLGDVLISQPQYYDESNQDVQSASHAYSEEQEQPINSAEAAIEAAQQLFTTKLVDLTDKLSYIKRNMTTNSNSEQINQKDVGSDQQNAPTASSAAAALAKRPEAESDGEYLPNDRARARYSQLQDYNGLLGSTINDDDTPNYGEEGWSETEEEPSSQATEIINRVMDLGRKWWSSS